MRKTALLTAVSVAASLMVAPMASAGDNGGGYYNVMLGPGTDETSVTVTWDQDLISSTVVDIISDPAIADAHGSGTVFSAHTEGMPYSAHHRKAKVSGLTPGQTYTYRVGNESDGWSDEMTFTAGSGSTSWSFAATGAPNTLVDDATWASTVTAATATHPELLVVAGNAMEKANSTADRYAFTDPAALQSVPTVTGSHSRDSLGGSVETAWHFQQPNFSFGNTAFTYNNVGFIGVTPQLEDYRVENFITSNADAMRGQVDWIVLFGMSSLANKPYLQRVASNASIDLVLSGNDYFYSRSHLLNANSVSDANKADGNVLYPGDNDTLFVSLNSATDRNLAQPTGDSETQAKSAQDGTPDYTTVDVTPEELTITTRDVASNTVIDTVTLSRKQVINPAPIASEEPTPTSEKPATPEPKPTTKKPEPTSEKPTPEPEPTPAPSVKPGSVVEKVTPGKATVLDDAVVNPTATLTGEVLDAKGTKVSGATVSVDKQGKVTVTLPKDAKAGTYTVQLRDGEKAVGEPITITVTAKATPTPKPKPDPNKDGSSDGSSAENMVWVGVGAFFGMIGLAALFGWLIGNVLGHARPFLAQVGIHI
ncbi:MAG: fibronectin type III domain-containing protein [Corynebacterium glucuronolyticum]|nr:fibronectin type III domain-containing protein [Mycobacteriaceae bacterium]MDY5833851.1 fibronectin type III domain-containing protein [Corynebacterium glucuronolyticum]